MLPNALLSESAPASDLFQNVANSNPDSSTRAEPPRVLVLAPLPPPIHGVAVMFDTLLQQQADQGRATYFHSPVGAKGKGQKFGHILGIA